MSRTIELKDFLNLKFYLEQTVEKLEKVISLQHRHQNSMQFDQYFRLIFPYFEDPFSR